MARLYNAADVIAVTNVTQRCLDHWAACGLIAPSSRRNKDGSKRRGRGSARLYNFDELLKIKIIVQLREAGLSLQKIQRGLGKLRKRSEATEPFHEVLMTDGKRFERRRADGRIEDLLRDGQLVFAAVALRQIEDDVRRDVLKLESPIARTESAPSRSARQAHQG